MLSTACATTAFNPLLSQTESPVEYLATAMTTTPAKRETMWRAARRDKGQDGELHQALMQSVPGHSGHNPELARKRLQAYAGRTPSTEGAALARLRVAELKAEAQCSADAQNLQQRLDKIVDIERTLDSNGHGKKSDSAR